jgi:hypothetical protein
MTDLLRRIDEVGLQTSPQHSSIRSEERIYQNEGVNDISRLRRKPMPTD